MLLDLSQMRGSHDRIDRTYDASAFEGGEDLYCVAAPVHLVFDIDKTGVQYRLVGRAGTRLRLTCSRCLERYELPVDVPFDLLYMPQAANIGDGEIEIEEDDLDSAYYRDDVIDLGQLVREQFYLTVPMKPLCQELCRGLCPECGTNLNTGSCSCRRVWEDPRLAALRSLLDEGDRTKGGSR
jgi:DUF177 domain-containing protein